VTASARRRSGRASLSQGMVERSLRVEVRSLCFDVATGKGLWKREFDPGSTPLPTITDPNSTRRPRQPRMTNESTSTHATGTHGSGRSRRQTVWNENCRSSFFIFDWGSRHVAGVFDRQVIFCQDDDLSPAILRI